MTTTKTLPSQSKNSEFRVTRPSDAVRYMIAGFVMLAVSVTSLFAAVTNWGDVDTSGFLGSHYMQLILAALGCALVVGGLVKSRKQR